MIRIGLGSTRAPRVGRCGSRRRTYDVAFNRKWQGKHYAIKQVAPVIKEEDNETVVITVYAFYF
jgi:hypothetical protein